MLKKYAIYRYGGTMSMDKFPPSDPSKAPNLHPTFQNMLDELDKLKSSNPERLVELEALRQFWLASMVIQVAGDELMGVHPSMQGKHNKFKHLVAEFCGLVSFSGTQAPGITSRYH